MMSTAHGQLVLRRREDWRIIRSANIEHAGDALTIRRSASSAASVYLGAVDSGERGFVWGRVSLEAELPQDTLIRTCAFASDDALEDPEDEAYLPVGESEDFYLAAEGRYLWLKLVFIGSEHAPVLHAVRLWMYGDHMLDYLPEIYRGNDFTKRFLSVFDSIAMDTEREIERMPERFDFERASGDMLRHLASWLSAEDEDFEDDASLREYMRSLSGVYESLYTAEGVRRSVRRLTGREPLIIESADVDPNSPDCPDSGLYRRLYGENPYRFFILLPEDTFENSRELAAFTRRMGKLIPANTSFSTVLLTPGARLDRHSYLNINTMVSDYTQAVIDESRAMNSDTTIGG
jgi:phage tail-like protein